MSYLIKLARFNRLYNVIDDLEKTAVSISAVQKAVGATGGRLSSGEAKALLRSRGVTGKDFSESYKQLRGKAGQTQGKGLQRAAIDSDKELLKLRAEQRQLSKELEGATLETQRDVREKLVANQRAQSARVKAVKSDLQSGNQDVMTRATQKQQQSVQAGSDKYINKSSVPGQDAAQRGGSFIEQAAVQEGSLKSQYTSLLKSKDVRNQAALLSQGKASPEMNKAWQSFQKNNPTATEAEFIAQSKLQAQLRNTMGNREGGSAIFGAQKGGGAVKNVAQELQYGKGQYQYAQDLANAQRAESAMARSAPQGANAQDYLVQQAQQAQQAARNAQINTDAAALMSSGKATSMDAALQQAQAAYQKTLTPANMVPLTPTQQVAQRYTGSAVGSGPAQKYIASPGLAPAQPLNVTPLSQSQSNIIQQVQAQNLPKQQAQAFNNTFNVPTADQARQATINAQTQATAQQRQLSQARGNQQQSGSFLGQYGMPLAIGTGVLGAGYLYANSGNQQQPNPSQGGV